MSAEPRAQPASASMSGIRVVDCDVHNIVGPALDGYLSKRWREYQQSVGLRSTTAGSVRVSQRPHTSRLDAFPPNGGAPGSDPDFARTQLLDRYDISVAIINNLEGNAKGNVPVALEADRARALNDANLDLWLSSDERWRASIVTVADHPEQAVKEIVRCRDLSDRFVQVLVGPLMERLLGNPKYWSIFEAAAEFNLPIALHPMRTKFHAFSGAGEPNYYFEFRCVAASSAAAIVPSLIFEGVFDRWPSLRIVLTECQWEWAVPLMWRMDATWRVLKDEVAHLQRPPSEYFLEHFWFTTQPSLETERPVQLREAYQQFVDAGFVDRMLYASDYPHWDMDEPLNAVPRHLGEQTRSRVFSGTADALYGFGAA